MGACASAARARDDARDDARDADADADDVAVKFDPLALARDDARATRATSLERHPTLVEALRSPNDVVRDAAKFVLERRVDAETERTFRHLKNLPALLPKPREGDARLTARAPPRGPKALADAFADAVRRQDVAWASASEIGALLADDVEYLNVHGEYFKGKAEVVVSLNASVRRVSTRMRGASARGDARTLAYMKVAADGPKYKGRAPNAREWSVWHIDYVFKVLLLTVKIREIYYVDDDTDLIRHVARCRVG